jgi:hypothetical protein
MESKLTIKDLFNNTIEVTSLKKAIEQTEFCCTSPYKVAPFEI